MSNGIGRQVNSVGFSHRFPAPWSVEEQDASFVVRDHARQKLAYVYFEDQPGRKRYQNAFPKINASG
jgi:hypothetical protein